MAPGVDRPSVPRRQVGAECPSVCALHACRVGVRDEVAVRGRTGALAQGTVGHGPVALYSIAWGHRGGSHPVPRPERDPLHRRRSVRCCDRRGCIIVFPTTVTGSPSPSRIARRDHRLPTVHRSGRRQAGSLHRAHAGAQGAPARGLLPQLERCRVQLRPRSPGGDAKEGSAGDADLEALQADQNPIAQPGANGKPDLEDDGHELEAQGA